MGVLDGQVARLRMAHERLVALEPDVEASAPPPGESSTAHEWAPGEILAHCAEMLPYWLGEIERVLAGSSEPVPFGRIATDPIRTLTVDRDRTLPIPELYRRIAAGVEGFAARLSTVDEAGARRRGIHPRLGEMAVPEIVERFVTSHLEEHADQLASTVGTATRTR